MPIRPSLRTSRWTKYVSVFQSVLLLLEDLIFSFKFLSKIPPKVESVILKTFDAVIVADNSTNLRLLNKFVSKMTTNIRTAINGQLGFQLIIDKMPNATIIDINMPIMDGIEMLENVKYYLDSIDVSLLPQLTILKIWMFIIFRYQFSFVTLKQL